MNTRARIGTRRFSTLPDVGADDQGEGGLVDDAREASPRKRSPLRARVATARAGITADIPIVPVAPVAHTNGSRSNGSVATDVVVTTVDPDHPAVPDTAVDVTDPPFIDAPLAEAPLVDRSPGGAPVIDALLDAQPATGAARVVAPVDVGVNGDKVTGGLARRLAARTRRSGRDMAETPETDAVALAGDRPAVPDATMTTETLEQMLARLPSVIEPDPSVPFMFQPPPDVEPLRSIPVAGQQQDTALHQALADPPLVPMRPMVRVQAPRRRRPRIRRVTRIVRHVDPWSVFKVAVCFSAVLYGVCLTAGVLLWNVAYTTGTIDNIERFFESFGWDSFRFKGGQIFHNAWIAGLFIAVGLTGLIVLAATLFNLITDLVGGIRVTVLEEEVVEREPALRRQFLRRKSSAYPMIHAPSPHDEMYDVGRQPRIDPEPG